MKDDQKGTPITTQQIVFLVPLLVIFTGIIIYIASLRGDVEAGKQHTDQLEKTLTRIESKMDIYGDRQQKMAEDLVEIKTRMGIQARRPTTATLSAIPNPVINPTPVVVNIQQPTTAGESAKVASTQPSPTPEPNPTPTPLVADAPILTLPIVGRIL